MAACQQNKNADSQQGAEAFDTRSGWSFKLLEGKAVCCGPFIDQGSLADKRFSSA
jgi:hypothetical protein